MTIRFANSMWKMDTAARKASSSQIVRILHFPVQPWMTYFWYIADTNFVKISATQSEVF